MNAEDFKKEVLALAEKLKKDKDQFIFMHIPFTEGNTKIVGVAISAQASIIFHCIMSLIKENKLDKQRIIAAILDELLKESPEQFIHLNPSEKPSDPSKTFFNTPKGEA